MLYDVPKTDTIAELAMARFVTRFRASSVKPEAFKDIPDATVALELIRAVDSLQTEGFSDRATLPILRWDASCDGYCIAMAARALMEDRGYNRQAGADTSIMQRAARADKWMTRMQPGPDGKRLTPMYEDSNQNRTLDGPRVSSMPTSDTWTQSPNASSPCCGMTGRRFPWP